MMLWEEGAFELKDPVASFIPAFADARVWAGGNQNKPMTRARGGAGAHLAPAHAHGRAHLRLPLRAPARRHLPRPRLRVRHAGRHGPRARPSTRGRGCRCCSSPAPSSTTPSPPTCSAGVVEVLSGQPLDVVLPGAHPRPARHDATPRFSAADPDRLAALYEPGLVRNDRMGVTRRCARRPFLSGGGGLISTAADYHRFTTMLLGSDGDGTACSRRRTLRFMARNHLPGGAELKDVARPTISETQNDGMGFGLGFSVVLDPAAHEGRLPARASSPGAGWPAPPSGSTPQERIDRAVLHAADPLEHVPAALAAAPARLPGAGGLMHAKLDRRPRLAPVPQRGADAAPQGRRVHAAGPAEHDAQGARCRCCATAAAPCR